MSYRSGDLIKPNVTEHAFQQLLAENSIKFSRRGYPDYIILYDSQKRIRGFVEVKPFGPTRLRPGQELFKRFCEDHYIPFSIWAPSFPFPE